MDYRAPRGTFDVLPEEYRGWKYIESVATRAALHYGYRRIETPVFENTGLFVQTVGEVTDIVQKEMYTFMDRSKNSLTLRPEATAPVCRAYLEHGMHTLPQPVRLSYFSSIFRYDRPQAGRYRQFHQFGVEAIGDDNPVLDSEVVELAWLLLRSFGLRHLTLEINSIGDKHCRPEYLRQLTNYYTSNTNNLCTDCQGRLHRNPLRLLDCKRESCQPTIETAPSSLDYLCNACNQHWESFLSFLSTLEIPYTINHRLVRGLDYYTRTVFEFQSPSQGSQNALCGGGRYDGLMERLGGRPTPGIGFALGVERVLSAMKRDGISIPIDLDLTIGIAHLGEGPLQYGLQLASHLRSEGISTIVLPGTKSLKGQMRHASALALDYVVIIGPDELSKGIATVRDMGLQKQKEVPLDAIKDTMLKK